MTTRAVGDPGTPCGRGGGTRRCATRRGRARTTIHALLGVGVVSLVSLGGCEGGVGLPPAGSDARGSWPDDGLLDRPDLQETVELALRRDQAGLVERLAAPDPDVRARAAFGLASVRDRDAAPELLETLADPHPRVREAAALALGGLEGAPVAGPLLDALEEEGEGAVRRRILEAVGRTGGTEELSKVARLSLREEDEAARLLAIGRFGLRGVDDPEAVAALVAALDHPDPEIRWAGSYYFGRIDRPEAWRAEAERLREVFDGYPSNEPAAMNLVLGLGRLGENADRDRLLRWLVEGEDWRIRTNSARALGEAAWLESPAVRGALLEALSDPSVHVGVAAATALTAGLRMPLDGVEGAREALASRRLDWRVQVPFLSLLAGLDGAEPVGHWMEERGRDEPVARVRGLEALAEVPEEAASALLLEAVRDPHPRVRGIVVRILSARVRDPERAAPSEREFRSLLLDVLSADEPFPAEQAALALRDPSFARAGPGGSAGEAVEALARIHRAWRGRQFEEGAGYVLRAVEEALESLEEAGVEESGEALAALSRVEEAEEWRGVDWGELAELGPDPRLEFRTEVGSLVVRLAPLEAPSTVQAIAAHARAGRYDGVAFHRVVPNFVAQSGDFALGDGRGSPGPPLLRTELTTIPFGRGALGMASSGRDTEGSQFFLTHSPQPHLDGDYTPFGWVEEGGDVLDRILEGHRILEVAVRAGGAEPE